HVPSTTTVEARSRSRTAPSPETELPTHEASGRAPSGTSNQRSSTGIERKWNAGSGPPSGLSNWRSITGIVRKSDAGSAPPAGGRAGSGVASGTRRRHREQPERHLHLRWVQYSYHHGRAARGCVPG